jgi:2-keto-myo-inositol isomerase
MIQRDRFAINRIACPSLGLEDFFAFAAELGLTKVELRNDLPGAQVTDGVPADKAAAAARKHGVKVITINALQHFNLKSQEQKNCAELETLLDQAAALGGAAIVLCPHNDKADKRDAHAKVEETVSALKAYGPAFKKRGIQGLVEPLGFPESSLASIVVAAEAIKRSGFDCYRVVLDTFHHYLGPDTEHDIDASFAKGQAGLIHVSAVVADIAKDACKDAHRVMPSAADRMKSGDQVARMVSLGYAGDISFEPFSAEVQKMDRKTLAEAVNASIKCLGG